ncbi:hypothetical protein ON010_g13591 [Phytophthora cinnamomi]|nr:hypothetical protein ON010_g13591 [Phytophthora cinnamomi]
MHRVVLVFGPMREIMMDGAAEFCSQATAELLELMQAKQSTPVPYRPKLLGLVERFHRTWKDIVSLYVDEQQTDWDDFLPCALYAYNGAEHATHGYQPNEMMFGRKLRSPYELLRRSHLRRPYQTLDEYHEVLIQDLQTARELAAVALQIVEAAGYDNYLVKMLESGKELVTHCSFLLPSYYPTNLLEQMARDIALDLHEEAVAAADIGPDDEIDGADQMDDPQINGSDRTADISVMEHDDRVTGVGISSTVAPNAVANLPAAAQTTAAEVADEQQPATAAVARDAEEADEQRTAAARRRGRPRKHLIAADASAAAERAPKRRRTRTTAALGDAIAGRTRARIRRGPYPGTEDDDQLRHRGDSPIRALAAGASLEGDSAAAPDATAAADDDALAAACIAEQSARDADTAEQPSDNRATGAADHGVSVQDDGAAEARRRQDAVAGRADVGLERDETHADEVEARNAAADEEEISQQQSSRRRQPAAEEAEEEPRVYVLVGQGRRGVDSLGMGEGSWLQGTAASTRTGSETMDTLSAEAPGLSWEA